MEILHSKILGTQHNSTPLLVFHGLFGMLDNWATFGKIFADFFPVHLIDLRNHGKSFHSNSMSHEDLARDIEHYMNFHGITSANILGHSLGGKAVMQFAITYPVRVEKMIVVDIAPKAYPAHHQGIFKALQSIDFTQVQSRGEVEEKLMEFIPEEGVVQFLTKSLFWNAEKKLDWRFNLDVLHSKYTEFVSNAIKYGVFDGPVLFVAGKNSNYILPQDEFLLSQQFPHYRIATIDNAGHWVHAENPKDFHQTVQDFLLDSVTA